MPFTCYYTKQTSRIFYACLCSLYGYFQVSCQSNQNKQHFGAEASHNCGASAPFFIFCVFLNHQDSNIKQIRIHLPRGRCDSDKIGMANSHNCDTITRFRLRSYLGAFGDSLGAYCYTIYYLMLAVEWFKQERQPAVDETIPFFI